MSINPLTPNLIHLFNSAALSPEARELTESGGSFADILTEAFGATSHTDAVDKLSSLELLMGESDDLSGLMIDMQKAELSLNLALQIRNKVIDAYNEVMRMSV
jgi:flagellar hook-basal body complex protein FliE